jgi:hypothetical protein
MPTPSTVFASCGSRSFCSARIAAEIIGAFEYSDREDGVGDFYCKACQPDHDGRDRQLPTEREQQRSALPLLKLQAELQADREQRDRHEGRADTVEDRIDGLRPTADRSDDDAHDERYERRERQDSAGDSFRARALGGIQRGNDGAADRERQKTAELIGNERELHALAAVQRFDHREADEGCIAEPAHERQCADACARPKQRAPERREQRPRAEKYEPLRSA